MRGPRKRVGMAERQCTLHRLVGGSRGGGVACRTSKAPESGLQKWRGQTECVRQQAGLNIWEVISEQLCSESGKAGGQREGELLSPGRTELFGGEQRLSPAPSPSPIPQPKSQREPVPARQLARSAQTPNAVLLWSQPSGSGSDSLPLPQGPS